MKSLLLRPAALVVSCLIAFSAATPRAMGAPLALPKNDYTTLPLLRGKENQLLLRLPANGRAATIALDTGSPVTCVDESKSKLFNLKPSSTENSPPMGITVNGIRHRVATIPLLLFGNLQVRDIPVVLIDLTDLNQVLKARRDRQNDAILGLDTMHSLGAVIDCGGDRLILRQNEDNGSFGAMLKRAGWREVPMHLNEGHLIVNGFANHIPTQFIIDTGSPVTVLDQNFCKVHKVTLSDAAFGLKAIHFETKGARIGKLKDLQIGKNDLGQSLVAVFDVTSLLKTRTNGGGGPNALLGSRTLARTQAFIDCETMKLYLKPPALPRDWGF